MPDIQYDVVFEGKIRDGADLGEVKENLGRLFKIDADKVEKLFTGSRVVLKSGVDRATADRYQASLAKAGAIVTLEPLALEATILAPEEPDDADESDDPDGTVAESVGPVWGRKVEHKAASPGGNKSGAGKDDQYGSLERGMAGDYQFTIGDTLSEAWQKVSGNKMPAFMAFLIYFGVMIGVGVATGLIALLFKAVGGDAGEVFGALLGQTLQTVVAVPLGVGILMLGVRMAIGAPAEAGSILGYYDRIVPLLLTTLLLYVMLIVGFLLFVIPGIYLSVAYMFALPLVVDKGLSPWQALEASRKAITHRWFSMFGLFLIIGLVYMLGALCLMVGLIWAMPLGMIAMGIVYRNIFGVSSV